jgi:hypothetical protein
VLVWHPGYAGAVAISGAAPTPEQCLPGGQAAAEFSNDADAIRAIDCLTYGGSKIDAAVNASKELTQETLDALRERTVSIAAYKRGNATVVAYSRYQKGLGDVATLVPAQDARYLARAAGRAFFVVGTGADLINNYYQYQGQDLGVVKAVLKTAVQAGSSYLGGTLAAAGALALCTTGVGCVVVAGAIGAVGALGGGWIGGKAADYFIEMKFDDPTPACASIGFLPQICPNGVPA